MLKNFYMKNSILPDRHSNGLCNPFTTSNEKNLIFSLQKEIIEMLATASRQWVGVWGSHLSGYYCQNRSPVVSKDKQTPFQHLHTSFFLDKMTKNRNISNTDKKIYSKYRKIKNVVKWIIIKYMIRYKKRSKK